MKKQSNVYTIIYIIVLVVVVGAALALTSNALKPRQQANADADKMRQILASVHITPQGADVISTFHQYITDQYIVDADGRRVDGDAFAVNVERQQRLPLAERMLPVYVCSIDDATKYILPLYGKGLWGPIWGYISLDDNGSTVYGAFFAHQGETPGLGAEIENPRFGAQFDGLNIIKDGRFLPIAVVKAGQPAPNGEDHVQGISGGTITSKGVGAMLNDCLQPYRPFLESLNK